MPAPTLLYRLGALCARLLVPWIALANPRLRRMTRERRESRTAFGRWAATARRVNDPVLVLHAASAGELRQLEPVLRRLRDAHPSWQLLVTWFSTSGAQVGGSLGADAAGALPWDSPWESGAFLDQVRPALIVVSKLDLWPELAWQAERRGIPVALIAATLRPESSRLRWPARSALHGAYQSLAALGAVTPEDATRLALLGAVPARVTVTGDPRYDAVVERVSPGSTATGDPLLVAGSTWPADELVLLPAFAEVRQLYPRARLLLVPHQPDPATTRRIESLAAALGLPGPVPLAWDASEDPLLLESKVGGLAQLYQRGTMAYVGGGFGSAGLHSVLEPAAAGVPMVIGPRHLPPEAQQLQTAGALVVLDRADAVSALARQWCHWLEDEAERARMGHAAAATVERGRGAASRSAALIERLVR